MERNDFIRFQLGNSLGILKWKKRSLDHLCICFQSGHSFGEYIGPKKIQEPQAIVWPQHYL